MPQYRPGSSQACLRPRDRFWDIPVPKIDWTPRSEAYFVFPLAQGTPGKQCGLAATGVYQPSLRSPWLVANEACLFV
ncbi:hypothetical protein [Thiolapillus sp.]|uniref:hypothetical protein n=1 Tax=Thiolapillus sp. TaxID=2017437 RepID=UPI003AF40EBB